MAITVLIVDDEENARQFIGEFLIKKGYEVVGASTLAEARHFLSRGDGDVVLLDVQLPDGYGPNLLYETAHLPLRPPIILITAYGDIQMAVDAMKNGAHDFLSKPIQFNQLEQSLKRATEVIAMRQELEHLRRTQYQQVKFIVGKSTEMRNVVTLADRAASAGVSVLITGETGTGKDVLAQYIHRNSPRANKPFIAINCAAIQPTLLESELFGYESGAFSGAEKRKHGLMEVADGGILFLDEISSMSPDIQAKLLRAVEERAFRRVGGTNLLKVDVQILAASNRDLKILIKENQFREDLYYRLKVLDLHIPPLRERKSDIPEFVGFFIRQHNAGMGVNVQDVSSGALHSLMDYLWPGNIRQLNHAIEHAVLLCDGDVIEPAHLPREILNPPQ
ncbi:MAG TPA: sigma-54 dependent transcriptional regulator [Anaerolineaceae bacterium]|jgi:DNA-binding NtrC family response regulator|nr:sigma-54 dependent transcriptional regulator [Anaerolineaceae bacterium]HOH20290.1 sigma-54 dependent transcriptional regulator [Anaerolineaceae bacterium]HOU43115.1 sigma-54 dependent transcriptional regulator [Anaerolineaceae bacterium]HPA32954.1 sigma-54 dependent transcriptional regulator [Anaerolineaceae bacterium]HQF44592.1 sigma-54 dependent transcriptional regulator [Anaerolineaceae bacterium]